MPWLDAIAKTYLPSRLISRESMSHENSENTTIIAYSIYHALISRYAPSATARRRHLSARYFAIEKQTEHTRFISMMIKKRLENLAFHDAVMIKEIKWVPGFAASK